MMERQERAELLRLIEAGGWRIKPCKNGTMCYPPATAQDRTPVMVGNGQDGPGMRKTLTMLRRRGWEDPRPVAQQRPKHDTVSQAGGDQAGDQAGDQERGAAAGGEATPKEDRVIDTILTQQITVNTPVRDVDDAALGDLIASIQQRGMLRPLVVDPARDLISGARRLAAARKLGLPQVPTIQVRKVPDACHAIAEERRHGLHMVPMTFRQLMLLEARVMALRTVRNSGDGPLHPYLAEMFGGVGTTWVDRARRLWHAAEHGPARDVARHLLDRLDSNEITLATAHRLWAEARDAADPRGIVAARLRDPGRQRTLLTHAAAQLEGLGHVLGQANPIHEDITPQEAAVLLPQYTEAYKALGRMIQRLKERTHD